MSDKRISALTEQTGLATGDFFAVDNAGETESKKIDQAYFSGQYDDMQNILGSKNLMPNEASTQVVSGITFTKYSDGRIKANGTASANINFTLSSSFWLPKGDYILTDGVKNQNYYVDIKNGSTVIARARDDGAFTLAADATLLSEIWITSGQTISNVTFYPMVRPANIPNTEYVPYAKSNKELTEDVASLNASFPKYPDMSNEIAIIGWQTSFSYTATQDCWAIVGLDSGAASTSAIAKLNGIRIAQVYDVTTSCQATSLIPLKKGDILTKEAASTTRGMYIIYGMRN